MAYNEVLYEFYADLTKTSHDPFSSIRLEYKLKALSVYELLWRSHDPQTEIFRSWENLDRNILELAQGESALSLSWEENHSSLTNNTLQRPGGIEISPVIFHKTGTHASTVIVHVGYKLCGYPFLVHGGMIATLFNECIKRNAVLSGEKLELSKDDYKVETLSITYRQPTFANRFLVVKTKRLSGSSEGSGQYQSFIETPSGKLLAESEAFVIHSPRPRASLKVT